MTMAVKFSAFALVATVVCITVRWSVTLKKGQPSSLRGGEQSWRRLDDNLVSPGCFTQLNLLHTNLGGKGPDVGERSIKYAMTFPQSGEVVVMKITSASEYTTANNLNNANVGSSLAQINVQTGSAVDLKFEFLDSQDEPVHLSRFMMAFLDFDQGRRGGLEGLTVDANVHYELGYESQVIPEADHGTRVTFSVPQHGTGSDNPTNVLTLNQQQKQRAVALVFPEETSEFMVTFSASVAPSTHGRNFLFTGVTSASCLPLITQTPISEEEDDANNGICAVDDGERTECGFFGITKEQCEAKGCCSHSTSNPENPHNLPWCFYPKSAVEVAQCGIEDSARTGCGFEGITPQECEARGCCSRAPSNPFNPESHPWCFHPAVNSAER